MPRQKEFFARQSPEVQEVIKSMSTTHTSPDIISELKNHGVHATANHISHYRHTNSASFGMYERVVPASTHHERIGQYIAAIRDLDWEMWKNVNIGCYGHAFSKCANKLCAAGMIKKVEGYRPIKYTRVVSDDEMDVWYAKEATA